MKIDFDLKTFAMEIGWGFTVLAIAAVVVSVGALIVAYFPFSVIVLIGALTGVLML